MATEATTNVLRHETTFFPFTAVQQALLLEGAAVEDVAREHTEAATPSLVLTAGDTLVVPPDADVGRVRDAIARALQATPAIVLRAGPDGAFLRGRSAQRAADLCLPGRSWIVPYGAGAPRASSHAGGRLRCLLGPRRYDCHRHEYVPASLERAGTAFADARACARIAARKPIRCVAVVRTLTVDGARHASSRGPESQLEVGLARGPSTRATTPR